MELQENEIQKAVLCGIDTGEFNMERSMDELESLAVSAGADVVARVTQKTDRFEPATAFGSGKLDEVAEFCKNNEVDILIFDHELTASQMRNISDITKTEVIDRTELILDIFAQRARTAEGRLQVELAQLKHRLPRLGKSENVLSRQGGGIGSRGPGEAKLETDRRYIRSRITKLEGQLKELSKRRQFMRDRRKKDGVTTVAIVGYTNVGKSTLLNKLTDAGVLTKNMLFATLDPTSRALELPDGREVMLIDTVGLISRLPHNLVEAFKSTLEEASNADLILNVCDITAENVDDQLKITIDLLNELGAESIPIVTVANKCDEGLGHAHTKDKTVYISAKTGEGIDDLLQAVMKALEPTQKRIKAVIPYDKSGLLNEIRINGKVFSEEYTEKGTLADALVDNTMLYKLEDYLL